MNYYEPLIIKSFLSEAECNDILNTNLELCNLRPARIASGFNEKFRKSSIDFIDKIDSIDDRLKAILDSNIKVKGSKVHGIGKYQFTKYDVGEHYDWHTDSDNSSLFKNRFCSIVIQLNNDYTGGNLEYKDATNVIHEFERGIGNLFIFYSALEHRVVPVETGVRYSLVNWVSLTEISTYKKTLI